MGGWVAVDRRRMRQSRTVECCAWFVCGNAAPDVPRALQFTASATSWLAVTWTQNGTADAYDVRLDDNLTHSVNFTGVGHRDVSAIIYGFLVPGQSYCVNVTASSYSRTGQTATLCNLITSKKFFKASSHVENKSSQPVKPFRFAGRRSPVAGRRRPTRLSSTGGRLLIFVGRSSIGT
jgi:hypothetical protein